MADFDGVNGPDVAFASWGDDSVKVLLAEAGGALPSATSFPAGDGATGLCAGEFTGDSHIDLIVSNDTLSTNEINLLVNNGSGGFGAPMRLRTITDPRYVECGDLDHDGNTDIAIETADDVVVLFGGGDSSIAAQAVVEADTNPRAVAIGDMNNDAGLDLLISSGQFLRVYAGGSRSFPTPLDHPTGSADGIAIVDLDGTGGTDVALALRNGLQGLDPIAVLPGAGDGTFRGPGFTTGIGREVRLVDLDADGDLDLVGTAGDSVVTMLGDGTGEFVPGTSVDVGMSPFAIVVADANEDDVLDVVSANSAGDDLSLVLGDGRGGFLPATSIAADGEDPRAIEAADFNEDGHIDLAIVNNDSRNVTVRFGDGMGGFDEFTTFPIPSTARSIAVGDLNNDRHIDVAVGHANFTGRVSIHYNDERGNFVEGPVYTRPTSVRDVDIVDVNNDNHPDLVVVANGISTYLADGAGGFGSPIVSDSRSRLTQAVVGDFDEDRHVDVVVGLDVLDAICLQRGDGAGNFGSPQCWGLGRANWLAAADLNGDYHLDVAASSPSNVAVYFNQ